MNTALMPFGKRFAAAAAGLRGIDPRSEVEALRAELADVVAERDALQLVAGALRDQLQATNRKLAVAQDAVTGFEEKVAARSVDLVAAAGIPFERLPRPEVSGEASGIPATRESLEAKVKSLPLNESIELVRKFNAAQGRS